MRKITIDNTFAAIRQLPLEVEFAHIEQFVLRPPLSPQGQNHLLKWLSQKNFLLMVTAFLLISFAWMMTRFTDRKAEAVSLPLKQAAAKDQPADELPAIANTTAFENDKISQTQKGGVIRKSYSKSTGKRDFINSLPVRNQPRKPIESKETIPVLKERDSCRKEDDSVTRNRVRTFSSCYCNFGEDDVWIKAFIKEMLKDNIITDTANLRFTISGKSLKVNGKVQDESFRVKYNDLYQSIIGEHLNEKSSISLSVSCSSCSLSKNIDN